MRGLSPVVYIDTKALAHGLPDDLVVFVELGCNLLRCEAVGMATEQRTDGWVITWFHDLRVWGFHYTQPQAPLSSP